jgi:hypothetical protein
MKNSFFILCKSLNEPPHFRCIVFPFIPEPPGKKFFFAFDDLQMENNGIDAKCHIGQVGKVEARTNTNDE